MPAHKRLTDEQIDALMLEFRAKRVRTLDFCAEKGIAVPTFKHWRKEWKEKTEKREREERLATLPKKPLAWLPPDNLSGRKEAPPSRDGLLTLMVDLADNLGPHLDQTIHITVCCGGLVVTSKLVGAQEYFDGMRGVVLQGASELMPKYRKEAEELFEKLLPDTERLPERRDEWDDFYEPDDYRDAPDYIHLADATIHYSGSSTKTNFWRGRLSAVSSFWTE